jgi:ATP phosphoribosyltransferase
MTTADPITIALPKGRLLEQAVPLFARAGYDISSLVGESRRLTHDCGPLRVLLLRPSDVPTYVDYGAADLGVTGWDVLEEAGRDLYYPLDLGIGRCRLVLAAKAATDFAPSEAMARVATKYPRITRRYLLARGMTADVIKLSGSVEIAPQTGLADAIVDLVESGETLRQNGLRELEVIMQVSARVAVNPAQMKMRLDPIQHFLSALRAALP